MLWTSVDASAATGGQSTRKWQASGVSIDTRSLAPGDLFVALKDIRDGHDFVAQALEAGAAAALVSRVPDGVAADAPLLVVPDVLRALEDLGRAARARTGAKVIGVTGSVGKTSTKEMLRMALAGQGAVHAAEKSFNNHWGVPLTLARMEQETNFAVIEIGMNHPGEIAPLARLAELDVALVITVAPAHLEAFDDIEGIAQEKASIFEGLRPGGMAIYNGDNETAAILRDAAPSPQVSFGEVQGDWRLLRAEIAGETTICEARTPEGQTLRFKLATPGRHFAMNAVATLAAVQAVGADLGRAVVSLGQWQPPQGRGRRQFVPLDAVDTGLGIDLFDDAYNANPASVAAALDVLAATVPVEKGGQRVAILGDMKELGASERALHAALAEHPAMEHIDRVHCAGPISKVLYDALPQDKRGLWAETSDELAAHPTKLAQTGDVVLVKGSLSMKMALIVDAIVNLGQAVAGEKKETP